MFPFARVHILGTYFDQTCESADELQTDTKYHPAFGPSPTLPYHMEQGVWVYGNLAQTQLRAPWTAVHSQNQHFPHCPRPTGIVHFAKVPPVHLC